MSKQVEDNSKFVAFSEKLNFTLEQIFLTVGQNNYGNKIPFIQEFLLAQVTKLRSRNLTIWTLFSFVSSPCFARKLPVTS